MAKSRPVPRRRCAGIWILAVVALGNSIFVGCHREPVAPRASGPVQVLIDFNGRGANKQFQVEWHDGDTAFSCLKRLEAQGRLKVVSTGSGNMTLLTAIDDVENLKAAGDNWIYLVNDKLGDRSSAVCNLNPGDRLVWRFGKYPVE